MAHDVFISYASQDKTVADAICAALENQKIRCWIAPRDVLPGSEYGASIVEAIAGSQAMVLVFSAYANESPHTRREVERAVSRAKIIVPFRIEDVSPSGSMEYALGGTHWLDALTPPLEQRIAELVGCIVRLLEPGIATREHRPLGHQPFGDVCKMDPQAIASSDRPEPGASASVAGWCARLIPGLYYRFACESRLTESWQEMESVLYARDSAHDDTSWKRMASAGAAVAHIHLPLVFCPEQEEWLVTTYGKRISDPSSAWLPFFPSGRPRHSETSVTFAFSPVENADGAETTCLGTVTLST